MIDARGNVNLFHKPRNDRFDNEGFVARNVTNLDVITRRRERWRARGRGGRGDGVGFINFIFRPKCYFLAARKGVVRGTVRRGERRQKRGKGEWLASGNAV